MGFNPPKRRKESFSPPSSRLWLVRFSLSFPVALCQKRLLLVCAGNNGEQGWISSAEQREENRFFILRNIRFWHILAWQFFCWWVQWLGSLKRTTCWLAGCSSLLQQLLSQREELRRGVVKLTLPGWTRTLPAMQQEVTRSFCHNATTWRGV